MLRLIYRQLAYDPWRTALTVFAIAAVVLVLEGFMQGQSAQLRRAVFERDADLIVTQAGTSERPGSSSSRRAAFTASRAPTPC